MLKEDIYETDVLVIGSGAAGALAAIRANDAGVKVIMVTKGGFGAGNTPLAPGGFEAAIGHSDSNDSPKVHFQDTVRAGENINNQQVVWAMANEILRIPFELDSWGCTIPKQPDSDKFLQHFSTSITYPRLMYVVGDRTGRELVRTFKKQVEKRDIDIIRSTIVIKLLKNKDRVIGIIGFNYKLGRYVIIKAKTTVLASGGGGQIYKITDNHTAMTGDGYVLAFEAGAELVDIEMIEFQLTICSSVMNSRPAKTTALIVNGARLFNAIGERFMKNLYPEEREKTTRSKIARAVYREILEGRGTKRGGVFLDISDVDEERLINMWPSIVNNFRDGGIDLRWQPMEICPGAHTFLGGIRIDLFGRTNISSLYAAGEVAGGSHGANRLPANALSDAMAFGSITGYAAAKESKNLEIIEPTTEQIQEAKNAFEDSRLGNDIHESEVLSSLKSLMTDYVSLERNEKDMLETMSKIKSFKDDLDHLTIDEKNQSKSLRKNYELQSMIQLAQIIISSALKREESRGFHYRSDFPKLNHDWEKNIVVKKLDGTISLKIENVVEIKDICRDYCKEFNWKLPEDL